VNRTALSGSALGTLLIVSFFLRGLFPGQFATPIASSPPVVVAPAAVETSAEPSANLPADGPWKASQSFFAGWGATHCAAATNEATRSNAKGESPRLNEKNEPRERLWCIPPSVSVTALIAIAPDPVRTHMSLTFDRNLEGLQLAAQDSGYFMDRYWLPWRVPKTDGKDTADSGDAKSRAREEARAAQPGLILFRRNAPVGLEPQVIFVFLVADTATTGIDATQFSNAVTYLDQVCGTSTCSKDGRIRVVGPSFSGSLTSLIRLTDAPTDRQSFTVYSGSVSSRCALLDQRLLPSWDARCGDAPADYEKRSNPIFKTFVHDAESAVERLVKTVSPAGDCQDHPPIAILSEAATTFGGAFKGPDADKNTKSGNGTDLDKDVKTQSSKPAPDIRKCIANYVYPREIASLRNAARAATANTTSGSSNAVSTANQLPLDLTDRTNSNDAPPDFSIVQSPLSKEAVLMNFAAGLRRAHYHYIGISGSNILDVLFLSNFLRTACPDSRLFILSADLIFERDLDNAPYIGMVAVTTYPLIEGMPPRLDDATAPAPPSQPPSQRSSHLPFADGYEQGQYQAALATFNELLGKTLPPFTELLATSESKPLWMTVVGTGGYWPVRVLDRVGDRSTPPLGAEDLSGGWAALLLLVSGIAAFQIAVLLTASPFAPRFRDFALVSAAPRQRLFYIQTACVTVACALGLLVLPAWRHAENPKMIFANVAGTVALIAIVGAAIMLEMLYVYRWRWSRTRVTEAGKTVTSKTDLETSKKTLLLQLLTFLGVWALAGGLFYAWRRLLGIDPNDRDSLYGYFFAYRAVHMGSGVSPLTPLFPLLIAVYAWTLFEIWRLRFNDDMRPRLMPDGFVRDESKRPRPGQITEQPIVEAINRYLLRPRYVVEVVLVFLIWLAFLHPLNPFQIFERASFSALYGVLLSLVVFLMLSSGFRMTQIWTELRQLLVEIDRRPIRAAFSRFKDMNWSFWRQGGEDAEWAYLVRSLESVAKLESGGRSQQSGLPGLEYFRAQIEPLVACAGEIHTRLAGGAAPSAVEVELTSLDRRIETVQQALASGRGNLLLRSAIDDARTCVTSSVDSVNASADLAKRGQPPPDRALLEKHVEVLPDKLQAALDVITLAEASEKAQDSAACISKVWLSLQDDRPPLPVWESLMQYTRPAQSVSCAKDVALKKIPRVSRFYKIETGFRDLQGELAEVLDKAWKVVETRQAKETSTLADPDDRHEPDAKDTAKLSPNACQLNVLEEFIALRYVSFIRGVLGHLRHVMIFLALSFSLTLISLNIYSFEPHQSLIWSFTLIFVVTGAMVVGVLVQLHRDPILSRVTGTTANALDLHFYLRLVAFGGVPLLTLLATHFPSIGRYLVGFLQPSLEALK
jgi:hypothetical protein